ncbi:MAG: DUF512 domain-containing protein [Chitinivibrionales bacterium]|nr:DUF512 domain-containing protein [Chitinivibrionales bacterium]
MLKIADVSSPSPAARAGMCKGDVITAINGVPIEDEVDFEFHAAQPELEVDFMRKNRRRSALLHRTPCDFLGIVPAPQPIRQCTNNCIFCFVNQLPPRLRKTLYIKDEDVSYSFRLGNYLTLSSAGKAELDKIIHRGLSPLYISVHATDTQVRKRMLRNRRAPDIVKQLAYLGAHGINFHTQIVACAGINDGAVLDQSLQALCALPGGLLSVAVVPVGLTKYHTGGLQPLTVQEAKAICELVSSRGNADARRHKRRRLFCADELYIKADIPLPAGDYYEEYPQIENGVGLIRQLLDEWDTAKSNLNSNGRRRRRHYLLVTSLSAYPFFRSISAELNSLIAPVTLSVLGVANSLFGPTVTVAGLLGGRDVLKAINSRQQRYAGIFIPEVILNVNSATLDGFSQRRMQRLSRSPLIFTHTLTEVIAHVNTT